jgi:hypothetical protein
MEVGIKSIMRAESYPQGINDIGAARKADVTGKGEPLIAINLSHLIKVAEKAFIQQSLSHKFRVSL